MSDNVPSPTAEPGTTDAPGPAPRADLNARVAGIVFACIVAIAVPVVLFGVGSYHWFFRDDFNFLTARKLTSINDLFRPHDSHWTTVPVVAFRGLWALFGMRSYLPYQATVLALHLGACALLRIIMRRAGVGPWIATAAAAVFVLFGPGEQNILWAFQIGFTGSVTFGLAQLVLADHDGPVDRRDALGLAAGTLALLSSGVGVAMAFVAGIGILGRRGWRAALLHTAPLGLMYIVWSRIEHPVYETIFGRPSIRIVYEWVRSSEIGTFLALGHFQVVAALLAIVLVVGLALTWWRPTRETVRRTSIPAAMLLGTVIFAAMTAYGRWLGGPAQARSSRYIHIGAALTLPALAVAIDTIARRWRWGPRDLGLALVAILLVAVPWNATEWGRDSVFGEAYMNHREALLRNIVRLPEATQVPRSVRPVPDVYVGPGLTIGFLLDAVKDGKLHPATQPLSPALHETLLLSLAVSQTQQGTATNCREITRAIEVKPAKGTVYGITTGLAVSIYDASAPAKVPLAFDPINGNMLTIELSGLDLRLSPRKGTQFFTLCSIS